MKIYKWILKVEDNRMKSVEFSSWNPEVIPDIQTKSMIEELIRFLYEKAKTINTLNDDFDEDNNMYGYELYINTMISKYVLNINPHIKLNIRAFRGDIGATIIIEFATNLPEKYIDLPKELIFKGETHELS